jgi:release factor glutamine methyltransferase
MQLLAALKDATERLTRSGVASPQVDAELLLAHVTGVSRGEVLAWVHTDRSLTADQVVDWDRLLARREKREPLQHLTGTAAFMSFEVSVGPGVFVPRPETQALVEAAIDQALAMAVGEEGVRILDLCSGSGVVAISLARAIPHANVSAVEASPEALAYLERNVENLAPNIRVVALSVAECVEEFGGSAFDMILANPPYVPVSEVPNDPEVATYDPAMALFGGADGLDIVHHIQALVNSHLRPGGYLAIEHSNLQGDAVRAIMNSAGMRSVSTEKDFAERERFTHGFRP